CISKEEVASLVTEIAAARERAAQKGEPESTIFEVETAMSFLYFRKKHCDLVLLETGMGGWDDATNVVENTILEIFTPISLDHMAFLGETTVEIARVKTGIIKQNSCVVSAVQESGVLQVLQEACEKQGAGLRIAAEDEIQTRDGHFSYKGLENCEIHLAGRHQIHNAVLAIEAVFALRELGYAISSKAILAGLGKARWEGRMQVMQDCPLVIMDGAHNPGAVRALLDSVERELPGRELIYIMGMFADKDYREVVRLSAPRAKKIYAIAPRNNPRALKSSILREEAAKYCPAAEESPGAVAALTQALAAARGDDVILIFGSLSFLWEIREYYESRMASDDACDTCAFDRRLRAEDPSDHEMHACDRLPQDEDALLARQAVLYMEEQGWHQDRAGLERMRELMQRLGNPQRELSFIHIAGSNGKGSTAAMLERILREAGYRTGLFTSPHLLAYNERIQVCGKPIADRDLASLVFEVRDGARGMAEKPNQFELGLAAAFLYFRQMHCEIVVLEVGMGGELDPTNVIDAPEAAVITNISLEHTQYLGNTLAAIAGVKAGIIKAGSPVVCYDQEREVLRVIEERAGRKCRQADFTALCDVHADLSGQTFRYRRQTYQLGLLGKIQQKNAAVVLECVEALRKKGWLIPPEAVRKGLERAKWPCRFELILSDPPVIADGAHNPQGVAICLEEACRYLPGKKLVLICGVLADKDYGQMLDLIINSSVRRCICVTPEGLRALPAPAAAAYLKDHGMEAVTADTFEEAARMALDMTEKDADAILCLGSLHAAGYLARAFRMQNEKK
ncbi:MAG: hypothetical protein IJI24_07700, partial [Lachnospiraceae bacterium]|nr:hypothetical protein [Lachnospiraceae bacterium]